MGTELIQHGDDPVPVELSAVEHTLHLVHREDGTYIDQIFATTDIEFDPNETDPQTAVEPQNKLTTTWGAQKRILSVIPTTRDIRKIEKPLLFLALSQNSLPFIHLPDIC